jgi:hypothetical protein
MEKEFLAKTLDIVVGRSFARLSTDQLIAFNDYLADAGFSISRMETIKKEGTQTGFRLDYHILANPSDEEIWDIFLDPQRSRAYVKGIVDETILEGGTFEFLVWADKPD